MKIAIDDGLSSTAGAAGIGNYSNVLYQGIKEYFKNDGGGEVFFIKHLFLSLYPAYVGRFLYLFCITILGQFGNYDIVHFTNYYVPLLKFGRAKYVVTIHDMGAWLYPSGFSKIFLFFIKYIIRRAVSIADLIITPSQAAKKDICDITKVAETKVHVCYNTFKVIWKPIKNYPKSGYLLFVGSIDAHKNISVLINAFARLKKEPKYKHMKLVIVGKKRGGFEEVDVAIKCNLVENAVSILGYVSDEELLGLYNGAEVLVMPSLYEGFGIPVIEAMACEVPVIVSDIPVFREIARDAALFYGEPRNEDLLFNALKKVLSDSNIQQELISKSKLVLQLYSRENFVKEHIKAYAEVMENKFDKSVW